MNFGFLKIDPRSRKVFVGSNPVALTSAEMDFLFFMAKNAGKTLSKDDILAGLYGKGGALYDYGHVPEPKIIDVFVCKIRKKLARNAPPSAVFLETVWGTGYRVPNKAA